MILVLIYFLIIIIVLILFIVIFAISFQRRKNKMLMHQLQAEKHYEQELAKSHIEIQENILKNIAWELHDNVGQLLSVANLQLNMLKANLPPDFRSEIQETNEIIKQSVQGVRSLSKVLNNDVILKNGLLETLKTEIDRINRLNYLEAVLLIDGERRSIDNSNEIIIFRIFQEALSNILKHAKASKLLLHLAFDKQFLLISLRDDGVGFNLDQRFTGSGMETMRNRAHLIQASFDVKSIKGEGSEISLKYFYHVKKNET